MYIVGNFQFKGGVGLYPEFFEITSLTSLVTGPGTIDSLGELIEPLQGKRALIVSDKDLKKIGMVDKVIYQKR